MNKINIKNRKELIKMRTVSKLASSVLEMIEKYIEPGVSTLELNNICHNYIVCKQNAYPAPLNYKGFPKSICTSINNVVCHGIPSSKILLKEGDIINIDVTVLKNKFHGDTSKMFFVGNINNISQIAKKLSQVTYECLLKAIQTIKPNYSTFLDIASSIHNHAYKNGFSVVEDFCGHGIGKNFHEEPNVLHYISKNDNIKKEYSNMIVKPGMIFTIEPMLNEGKKEVKILNDGWTAITKDNSLSAQWEHTIAVTNNKYEVLTKRTTENF